MVSGTKQKPLPLPLPPKSSSPPVAAVQDEIEIEIAEVLYGMMRMPLATTSKQESEGGAKTTVDVVNSKVSNSQTLLHSSTTINGSYNATSIGKLLSFHNTIPSCFFFISSFFLLSLSLWFQLLKERSRGMSNTTTTRTVPAYHHEPLNPKQKLLPLISSRDQDPLKKAARYWIRLIHRPETAQQR